MLVGSRMLRDLSYLVCLHPIYLHILLIGGLMNRDGKFWNSLIWTLFILMIGIAFGMWWRIKQVEPNLSIAQAEIKRSHSLMVKDLVDLDVRLTLIEKQIHGTRVKK